MSGEPDLEPALEEEEIPVDLDGTPLDRRAIQHPGWSRNLVNAQIRAAWQKTRPARPYVPPAPRPELPLEKRLNDELRREGWWYVTHRLFDHLRDVLGYELEDYPYEEPARPVEIELREPVRGLDPRRYHPATQKLQSRILPNGWETEDNGAVTLGVLEVVQEVLEIEIPGWPMVGR